MRTNTSLQHPGVDVLSCGDVVAERYSVVGCLGFGERSAVYYCHDLARCDAPVVIKVLLPAFIGDQTAMQRFQREVVASFRVKDPNVVQGLEVVSTPSMTGYVMEHAGARTLKDYLSGQKVIDIDEAIVILSQACSGLKAIHQARIIHRDIKPGNIFITEDNVVKLSGFALARLIDKPSKTKHGEIHGTVGYASPEYLQFGTLDNRSDIYGMGLVAYEMIAGDFPFIGSSPIETLKQRLTSDPVPLSTARRDCPHELALIVERAMARNVARRYQNVEQMESDLRELRNSRELETTMVLTPYSHLNSGKIISPEHAPKLDNHLTHSQIERAPKKAQKSAPRQRKSISTSAFKSTATVAVVIFGIYGLGFLPAIFAGSGSENMPLASRTEALAIAKIPALAVVDVPVQITTVQPVKQESAVVPLTERPALVEAISQAEVAVIAPAPKKAEAPVAKVYSVHPGDVLYRIAVKFGVTQEALMNSNQIVDADILEVGHELKIPAAGEKIKASPELKAKRQRVQDEKRAYLRELAQAQEAAQRAAREKEALAAQTAPPPLAPAAVNAAQPQQQ